MRTVHYRQWLVTVAFAGIAIALFYSRFHALKRQPDQKKLSAAEDEVYEAVVRDMVTPAHGQTHISQLVFEDTVLSELSPGADLQSCKENVRKHLRLESSTLLYDSLADKVYRLFTDGYDDSFRADTIQDFLEKSCTGGRLSQKFHTDLPRTFIAFESVHFNDWPIELNGLKSFEQVFPGAGGIISFSHIGFDSTFQEAMVSTSFACGGLCGTGSRYVLRKKRGRWEVVNKWVVWVS